MMIFEMPPKASGNEMQQIAALRAYLVRLAQQLNEQNNSNDTASDTAKKG